MKLHGNPMSQELFENVRREGIETFTRNELSLLTLDALGILLMRATFMYFPELNDLPVMEDDEVGSEIHTCTVDSGFNSKLLFTKTGLERLLGHIARACVLINGPVMQGTMKVSVAFGKFNNELKIALIWVQ